MIILIFHISRHRSDLTAFFNGKEEHDFNLQNTTHNGVNLGSVKHLKIDPTIPKKIVEEKLDKKSEGGVEENDRLCRELRDFHRTYLTSREVVLRSLLSRAGVPSLDSGLHH